MVPGAWAIRIGVARWADSIVTYDILGMSSRRQMIELRESPAVARLSEFSLQTGDSCARRNGGEKARQDEPSVFSV